MTQYQQFATGFIAQCLHDGLTITEMKKVADDLIQRGKSAGLLDGLMAMGKGTVLLGALAPPIIGAGLGHGLAKATDINPKAETDDIKSQETVDAYNTETERLNRLIKLRKAANRRPPRPATL